MADHYQVVVLGAGPGGYIAALKAAQLGATVAVVEKHHLGGTCLNYGCIPSKALLASAELIHRIREAASMGVTVGGEVGFDWKAIQKRKDITLKKLRGGIKALFGARKIALHEGTGKLAGPCKIQVTSSKGEVSEISADKIILAVGSTPARIPGWPTDPEYVCTSDESLHWKELPQRLLIVGGGVIGCEFACMMEPLGVEVTIVEMMPRLIPEMDADLASELTKALTKRGIAVHTDTKVENLAVADGQVVATLSGGQAVQADKVLVATGRRAATADIGLETVGIETERGFVPVNDKMETAAPGVYCIGDANGRTLLAHAASAHGVVAAENAVGHEASFDQPIPWCVYTFPEIAGVGLTQDQCRQRRIPVAVGSFPIGHLGKAMAVGETDGFVKVLRHRETGAMVGVHMLGHNVTEIIASAAALMGQKVSVQDVAETVFAHPTISESFKEAAEDALGQALHLPPRKVLRVSAGG